MDTWQYDNPFGEISVRLDYMNETLEKRFVMEANEVLDKVIADVETRTVEEFDERNEEVNLTPFSCVQTFVSDCLLEKFRYGANRVLYQQGKAGTTKEELLGLLILHVLCAAYGESATTLCDVRKGDFFFEMRIKADRYHSMWGAHCGKKEKSSIYDMSATGWSRIANRATTDSHCRGRSGDLGDQQRIYLCSQRYRTISRQRPSENGVASSSRSHLLKVAQ